MSESELIHQLYLEACQHCCVEFDQDFFQAGYEAAQKRYKKQLEEANGVIEKMSDAWCIKPECECYLCSYLEKYRKKDRS